MAIHTFDISIGATLDRTQLDAQVASLYNEVAKRPLMLNTQFQGATIDKGNAEVMLQQIQQQAKAIDEVIVKQETWKNAIGQTKTGVTEMTVKWRDALGNIFTTTEKITSEVSNLGAGYRKVAQDAAKYTVGAQSEELQKYYDSRLKDFDSMSKRAQEWSIRAETMGDKEKQAIQKTSAALKQKIELYRQGVQSGNVGGLGALETEIRKENQALNDNIAATKRAATGVRGWIESVENAVKQTVSYTFSIGALRSAQMLLNDAIQHAIELNKEMVNIQLLQAQGAQSDTEIKNLATSYNNLARQMGVTTGEVAKGSVEWLRQGKTIQETTELLRASTMLSKLGNVDAAQATEYLTSTLNGYGMAAEEAVNIVNKLVAVDNVSATSVRELATALQYSAASAKDSGVTFEQLVSYIGIVSATTRQNAESIGQAFKTIFARMQDIKAGKIDEDGMGINNVESALAPVDIKLRDSATSFRDMSSVLQELSSKWKDLNEIEQANIAKAIAG